MARIKYWDPESGEWKYADSSGGSGGKSAYQYARDGGFTGTEEEFGKCLAAVCHTEPAENDVPKVFIDGVIPKTKEDVLAEMRYVSSTEIFHAFLEIKCQGTSSMGYPKKNFTIKMYSDETRETKLKKSFKDWGHNGNKYVLKANYIDHSHARNIVAANLWSEVVASRPDYGSLPEELRSSPRNGAVDGFPVKVYTNGTYQGIYTWNIGKEDWTWGMEEDNANHILLCAETNSTSAVPNTPCNFRELWSGTDGEYWSVEVGTNSDAVKNSLNALISCIRDTDDDTFKAAIGTYLDVQSAIDYYLHQLVIYGKDGMAKNMLLATYDGVKWRCGAYDMDSTFGLEWNGSKIYDANMDYTSYNDHNGLLWERISTLYADEVSARYRELRDSVYSVANMVTKFERFMDTIGLNLYGEDVDIYPEIPQPETNNIQQIRNFIRNRRHYVDALFGIPMYNLAEETALDGTNQINTCVSLDGADEYTVLLDYTVTSLELPGGVKRGMLLSNSKTTETPVVGWGVEFNPDWPVGFFWTSTASSSVFQLNHGGTAVGLRNKFAIRRKPDGTYTAYSKAKHGTAGVDITQYITDGEVGHSLIIGAHAYSDGSYEFRLPVTVHGCQIYKAALTDDAIASYLSA